MTNKLASPALLAAAWIVALSAAPQVGAAPGVRLSPTSYDFGNVPQHSSVRSVFWVHSTGNDTLRITRVIPGCGCTRAPLEKEVLAPGDSTRLEIIFDSKSFQGNVVKSPRIETNAGKPDAIVTFSATVTPAPDSTRPVTVSPYKLDISQFGEKPRSSMTFTIKNFSDQELTLTPISLPDDLASFTIPAKIPAGGSVEGKVTLKEAAMKQQFERSFTFQLNDPNKTRMTVPLKREIRSVTPEGVVQTSATGAGK